jgi:hypothetical protein
VTVVVAGRRGGGGRVLDAVPQHRAGGPVHVDVVRDPPATTSTPALSVEAGARSERDR